ncbi:EpsG family protein [Acinetobacter sp. YH16057]|uniref:EpsG family protein n=1 Tax=Acinetobacter sp. YH16057 TaxID=2601195 RepID=UPI0015D214FD|nr:EpsG family protein [Acinetobacter sp. YH16057]
MRIYYINFLAFIIFFLNPVLGFLTCLVSIYKNSGTNISIFIYSLFVSISVLKNQIYADSIVYRDMYNNVTYDSIGEFDGYITYKLLALFFKSFGIPYEFLPFFHVFFMVYFIGKLLMLLKDKYNFSNSQFLFMLIGLTILSNPVVASMGQRNSLAIILIIYAIILYFNKNYIKGFLFLIFSLITHFTMFFFLIPLILSSFSKLNNLFRIFLLFCSIVLGFYFNKVSVIFFSNTGVSEFNEKYQEFTYGLGSGGQLLYSVINYSVKFIFLALFLFFLNKSTNNDKFLVDIKNFIFYVICLCFIFMMNPIAFGRFTNYLCLIIFIYISLINANNSNKLNLYNLFMFFFLFFYFSIFNVFPWKEPILNGKMLEAIFLSPLITFWNLFI